MICDRKKLVAALGKALKYGYELYIDGSEIHIITQDWCFSGSLGEIGNELPASIVLQLGVLPRSCCISVIEVKIDGEKVVQRQEMLPDVFFTQMAADWGAGGELTQCVFTSLKLGSALLYQLPDGRILGAKVSAALLTNGARIGMADGERSIAWMDDDSQIRFRAHRPAEESELRTKWEALESVRWREAEA